MRIANAGPDLDGKTGYTTRWSLDRCADPLDDAEGSMFGDLRLTVQAIEHWMIERRNYRDVPAFSSTWMIDRGVRYV